MNTREETYHMTDKEMARLIVAERLIEGEIRVKGAAEVLGLSTRLVKSMQNYKFATLILVKLKCIIYYLTENNNI
ncbi:MAG: hypothetical protein KKG62_00815 [Actinobacteria bacterium]|nr:hypothetical protein [Actinomycetota bacterium]